jgi:hypothetical protein
MKSWIYVLIPLAVAQAADFCDTRKLTGPYAFQLSGMTDISGSPQPTVSVGRVVLDGSGFDGTSGKLSGTSSAMFSGVLLGNPIAGTYDTKPDCSITWQLQDDSGAFQHFSGKITPDLKRVQFSQTDKGGTQGVMQRTSDSCTSADLEKKYNYTASGSTKAMQPGQDQHNVSAKGMIETDTNGTFQVDSDCTVNFVLQLPDSVANTRGFLVNGGREILAFQTDPGAMVAIRMTATDK